MSKVYTLVKSGRHNREIKGTLSELNRYFGFSCKSVKAIVNKAQKQYEEREAACYDRTFIHLKEDENDNEIMNTPCKNCGETQVPLHPNGLCGNCFVPEK